MARIMIKLRRTIEIEIVRDFEKVSDARRWVADNEMDDLQHEGNIARDQCKVIGYTACR